MLPALCALFLALGLSPLGQPYYVEAGNVNITVDDTDSSSIIYEPTTAWFFSGNASDCTVCLTPPSVVAHNDTWHQGLYIPPASSVNDTGGASRSGEASAGDTSKRRFDLSDETRRRAAPGPSRDVPVTVQLNFTGSAIYLYSILPLGKQPNANSTPTLVNLTFTFDSEPAGTFLHRGSANNGGFQSAVSIFSRGGLSDSTHTLLVKLEPNSVFLFDYYVVSRANCSDSNPCPTHTQTSTENVHKHNIGSIAGAVGGSIAMLVMFAACFEFNIYRRRRRAARRPSRDRDGQVETQSIHSDVSGNPPLLPRYYPRTLSNAPPPYVGPAEESSVATQSDSSTIEMHHQTPPPFQSTPSPGNVGDISPCTHHREPSDLPPPFFVVSSPSPPIHANAMPQTTQQNSPRGHTEDT